MESNLGLQQGKTFLAFVKGKGDVVIRIVIVPITCLDIIIVAKLAILASISVDVRGFV